MEKLPEISSRNWMQSAIHSVNDKGTIVSLNQQITVAVESFQVSAQKLSLNEHPS